MPTGNARLKLLDPFAGYFCARRTKSTQNAVYKSSSYSTPAFVPDKKLQSQPSKYGHAQNVIKVFFTAPSTFTFHFHFSLLLSLSVPCLFFLCWKYTMHVSFSCEKVFQRHWGTQNYFEGKTRWWWPVG